MTTMMQHPKHGKHPATGHEVEHMKTLGWTVCPPKVKEVIGQAFEGQADDHFETHASAPFVVATLEAPAPRRRGPNKPKAK